MGYVKIDFAYSRNEYENIDRISRPRYLMLIQKIEKEGPFTAFDFFNVDRSLVTGALATVITYLIILIQFHIC